MFVTRFLFFNVFLVISSAAPPVEHNGRTFRNALNQQGLQTILQSIEERLRNLDQVYSMRYSTNINNEYIRKIEMLENKLSRMESQIEAQLEKISENMSSKTFKDDIAKDQIFRKIDSVYERINHKLSYVEGKLDMDILKLQTKVEAGISKIERLDHSFSVRQADMESEVSEAVEIMDSVRNNVLTIENKLVNITKNAIENTFKTQTNTMINKFDNISNLILQIDKKINNSLEMCNQKDVLNDFTNKDTPLTKTIKGYEDQIQSYGNKVNNMYNELWKKSTTIENTIKNSVLLMNLTRREIQDLKKAGHKVSTHNSQNDGQLEIIVDSFTNTIQRKFAELGRKLESNFENVMLVQNLFLESCHRIQMDESQLENKISLVLEKLLDAVTNRSINTFKEIQTMEELIKSHDSNVYRTLNQNTNTLIKLSEKTSEDRKKLEKILSTMKKDIGNVLETIQNEISSEDQENSEKIDTIASILLELQEQVNDLDNRVNDDNINYNAKQILQDILVATKAFPDKDTFAHKFNETILHNAEDISNLMRNIYHLLTSIDTKINKSYLDYQPTVNNYPLNTKLHQDTIDTNITHKTNITNYSVEENGKLNVSDEVSEPVDVVLEILPERNYKNSTKNSSLSRFNYTLITDHNKNMPLDYQVIHDYIPVASIVKYLQTGNELRKDGFKSKHDHNSTTKKSNEDVVIQVNNKKYDVPEASTITNKYFQKTEASTITSIRGIYDNGIIIKTKQDHNSTTKKSNEDVVIQGNNKKYDVPEASTISNKYFERTEASTITSIIGRYDNGIIINGRNFDKINSITKINIPTKTENLIEQNDFIEENIESTTKDYNLNWDIIEGIVAEHTTQNINKDTKINQIKNEKYILNNNNNNQKQLSDIIKNILGTNDSKNNLETKETILNQVTEHNDKDIKYFISNKNEQTDNISNENTFTEKSLEIGTEIPVNTKNISHTTTDDGDISTNGFLSKSENNRVIINGNIHNIVTEPTENSRTELPPVAKKNKNFPNVNISSTIVDVPISNTTIKGIKIESVTKESTETFDGTVDEIIKSATVQTPNSFEYTDLKNNTNDEHTRDDYDWEYED